MRRTQGDRFASGTVYLEFTQIGDYQRVAAIDAATGIEVVVAGPLNAARHDLERLAAAKLKRRLAREADRH